MNILQYSNCIHFYILYLHSICQMFINNRDKFQLSIITKNQFYHNQNEQLKDYLISVADKENRDNIHRNHKKISKDQTQIKVEQTICNLQDLWNNFELQDIQENDNSKSNKVLLIPMEIHEEQYSIEQQIQLSLPPKIIMKNMQEDHQNTMMASQLQKKTALEQKQKLQNLIKDLQNEDAQNFEDLWNEVESDRSQNDLNIKNVKDKQDKQKQTKQQNKCLRNAQLQKGTQNVDKNKQKMTKLQIIQEKNIKMLQNSTNLNLSKDFVIYDYQTYFLSFYSNSIFSYFGFHQCPIKKHHYFLYDLTTGENIMQCYQDKFRQIDNINQKTKSNYQNQKCYRFTIVKTGQLVATAFYKNNNNGLIYNVKPFNYYQDKHEDTMSLIQITDGYLANNCYCDTSVYVSQKYSLQPGKFRMSIGFKNGYLIANMGVNGVKSAPYNCRLQNQVNKNFSFLLGLVDKETSDFLIRIGDGMSPLLGMATSVGRKRYIDSFHE